MIIITGATKGMGRAICQKLSTPGQKILAIARTETDLIQLQAELKQRSPEATLDILASDLATEAGCEALAAYLRQATSPPSVLINNLGLFIPGGLMKEEDVFEAMLATNLLAAHRLSRIALPTMLAAGSGHLITIGSVATIDFAPHMTAYAASKYALEGWHKAISVELKETPIKTSLLIPGATLTAAWEGVENLPKNILAPEQIAEVVAFLLSLPAHSAIPTLVIRPQ